MLLSHPFFFPQDFQKSYHSFFIYFIFLKSFKLSHPFTIFTISFTNTLSKNKDFQRIGDTSFYFIFYFCQYCIICDIISPYLLFYFSILYCFFLHLILFSSFFLPFPFFPPLGFEGFIL